MNKVYTFLDQLYKAHDSDMCYDLVATEKIKDNWKHLWFKTNCQLAIPDGYGAFVFPRSSISKYNLIMANSVGVIDTDYTGVVQVRFNRTFPGILEYFNPWSVNSYTVGDRIAQIYFIKKDFTIMENSVPEYINSERDNNGFGSTGK